MMKEGDEGFGKLQGEKGVGCNGKLKLNFHPLHRRIENGKSHLVSFDPQQDS